MVLQVTPFTGSVAGLSLAADEIILVDGTTGMVSSYTAALATHCPVIKALRGSFSNQSLLTDATPDATCPFGTDRVLTISFPAQSCSPGDTYQGDTAPTAALAGQTRPAGGSMGNIRLPRAARRALLRYAIRPPVGFDWRLGGKLPGLSTVSTSASGGVGADDGVTSFTARFMWKESGRLETYLYMADNQTRWGTVYGANVNNGTTVYLTPGAWNLIEQEVWVNDIGQANGGIRASLNGVEFVNRSDLTWRTVSDLFLGSMWFCTFFGGNTGGVGSHDDTWETLVNTSIDFGDLYVEILETA